MASAYFALKIIQRQRSNRFRKEAEKFKQDIIVNSSIEKKICRICLKDGSIAIYGREDNSDISELIKTFGDIEISTNDNLPKHLCEHCQSLLQSAVLFRKLAKESAKILNENLQRLEAPLKTHIPAAPEDDLSNDNEVTETKTAINSKCKLCKVNFSSSAELVAHKKSRQHRNVRLQCPTCKRLFTVRKYKGHLARHANASHLICEVCGKMFRKDNLKRHLQLHNFELPFQCLECPYRGRYIDSLKLHMRSHTGEKPFNCDKCQLRFLTRSNLNRHLVTHRKDRPFKCTECTRSFYTKQDINIHYKCNHAGIKEFDCQTCGNKYGSRKAVMRHELRVHKREKMAQGRLPLYLQTNFRTEC